MKRVIKNQKKMKNTMYIVFGTFALALFAITRSNPSFANEGLIIDNALYMIAEQTIPSDNVSEEDGLEASDESLEGDEDVIEPELTPDERLVEGDEISQDLEDANMEGNNDDEEEKSNENQEDKENEEASNEVENDENETINEEDNETAEITEKTEEVGSPKDEDNNTSQGSHGVSVEAIDNELAIEILTNTLSNMDNNIQNEFNNIKLFESEDEITVTISGDDLSRNTFKYKTITIGDYTIMDRNLGAKKARDGITWADNSENYNTENDYYGYYYQRGNNYGFSNTTVPSASNTIFVPDEFIPSGFSTGIYSIIKIDNSNLQPDLRGEITNNQKGRQGPCPDGRHIPSLEDRNDIYNTRKNWSGKSNRSSYESKNMAKDLLLPPAGYRDQNNNPNISAVFLQSTTLSSNEIRLMRLNEYYATVGALMRRHYGIPIRCVMNYDTFKVNFITNNNIYKYQDIKNGRKATVPVDPQFENGKLVGWYEANETTKFDFGNTQITDNLNLYAKWSCNSGYYLNDNQDACIAKQALLIANNGTNGELVINEKIIELPFENVGYEFLGRNTEENGNGKWYYENDYINDDGIILYAQREKNPRYTLNPNGGIFNDGGKEYILKSKYKVPAITASTEYKFEDEYIEYKLTGANSMHINIFGMRSCTGGIKIYDRKINDIENISPWYTYIYNRNNSNESDYEKNKEFDIPSNIITIYTYGTTSTCPGAYYNIEIVGNGFYEFENELKNPTRSGYEFLGWYETGAIELFDFTGTEVTEDKTFYAKWKENTYTVSFDADNDGVNPGDMTVTYDSEYPELPVVNKTGYTFSGWYNGAEMVSSGDIVKITEDVTLKAKRKMNQYKIIFDTDGGNEISSIEKDYNSLLSGMNLPTPTKECNAFSGWDIELPERMPAHDITLKAIWNYTCSRSSGGGGAKKSETTTREVAVETPTEKEHNSADEKENTETPEENKATLNNETSNQVISVTQEVSEDGTVEAVVETVKIKNTDIVATVRTEVNPTNSSSSSSSSVTHTKEQNDAYSFAKSNGITTTESIEEAKMNTELTRIQMAKMLSNFAMNVLGQEPDTEKGMVNFDDVTNKMDKQYDNAVTKAYQLGIMGQNVKNNEFRPNDTVTRAEFASSLSRLLYHTEEGEYKGTGKYYIPHVAKLYNEGIINKADSKIKEKRGYVMTMLMRTVE